MTDTTEDRRVARARAMVSDMPEIDPDGYLADLLAYVGEQEVGIARIRQSLDEQTALVRQLTEAIEAANAMAAAIRSVVWDTGLSREQCGDRTLVGLVRILANKLDEARENRRGEYEHRTKAEALVRQQAEEIEKLSRWSPKWRCGECDSPCYVDEDGCCTTCGHDAEPKEPR